MKLTTEEKKRALIRAAESADNLNTFEKLAAMIVVADSWRAAELEESRPPLRQMWACASDVGRLFGVTAEGARKWLRPLAACGKVKVCRPQADTGNIFYFLPDVEREFIQNAATARLKK